MLKLFTEFSPEAEALRQIQAMKWVNVKEKKDEEVNPEENPGLVPEQPLEHKQDTAQEKKAIALFAEGQQLAASYQADSYSKTLTKFNSALALTTSSQFQEEIKLTQAKILSFLVPAQFNYTRGLSQHSNRQYEDAKESFFDATITAEKFAPNHELTKLAQAALEKASEQQQFFEVADEVAEQAVDTALEASKAMLRGSFNTPDAGVLLGLRSAIQKNLHLNHQAILLVLNSHLGICLRKPLADLIALHLKDLFQCKAVGNPPFWRDKTYQISLETTYFSPTMLIQAIQTLKQTRLYEAICRHLPFAPHDNDLRLSPQKKSTEGSSAASFEAKELPPPPFNPASEGQPSAETSQSYEVAEKFEREGETGDEVTTNTGFSPGKRI